MYSSTIKINVKAIVQSIVKQANIIIVNHIDLSIVINDDYKCNGLKIGDQFEEFGPYYIKDWQDVYQVNIVGSVSADDASAAVIDGTRFNFGDWSRKVNITSAITLSSANITILAEAINKECCKCNFKGTLSISFDIK